MRFLLRFDDLCPTLKWSVWNRVEDVLLKNEVRPILAVVPNNQDPVLEAEAANADFWSRARAWQSFGWTIGLHGFAHVYDSRSKGLVGRRSLSEFAGVAPAEQRRRVFTGVQKLAAEGLFPRVWVAPGHSFDRVTIEVLKEAGIWIVSDGFSRFPYCEGGVLWVPQQLWSLRTVPSGVWTVCYHINDWGPEDLRRFEQQVLGFKEKLVSLDSVSEEYRNAKPSWWTRTVKSGVINSLLLRLWCRVYSSRVAGPLGLRCANGTVL